MESIELKEAESILDDVLFELETIDKSEANNAIEFIINNELLALCEIVDAWKDGEEPSNRVSIAVRCDMLKDATQQLKALSNN